MSDTPDFDAKLTLGQIAMSLEARAQLALRQGQLELGAHFAQAAALYHCADTLRDIQGILEAWPVPDA